MTTPNKNITPNQAKSDAREVEIALVDFFVDKEKSVRVELSPYASKLAWVIKRLVGVVQSEDLDSIQRECPKKEQFMAFLARASALETAAKKAKKSVQVYQLSSVADLVQAEASLVTPPAVPEI